MDKLTSIFAPIHSEGHRFVLIFGVATLVLFVIWEPLGWIGVLLTAWCVYFFRDPDRVTPQREGLVVAPADGVVSQVADAVPPGELGLGEGERPRISIFMNVFDVHVNRAPIAGVVKRAAYRPGKFLNADLDKASEDNERQSLVLEDKDGRSLVLVQIAGLVARRIVCDVAEGDRVETGERFGIIRFGSRVDVYLEPGTAALVAVGQRMIAGETVIADLQSSEGPREGRTL